MGCRTGGMQERRDSEDEGGKFSFSNGANERHYFTPLPLRHFFPSCHPDVPPFFSLR